VFMGMIILPFVHNMEPFVALQTHFAIWVVHIFSEGKIFSSLPKALLFLLFDYFEWHLSTSDYI
jgi:hypothetical protein